MKNWQAIFERLDTQSRTHALSDEESLELERAIIAISRIDDEKTDDRREHRRHFYLCGHPRTAENTRRVGITNGVRCRECRMIIARRSRERLA